MATNKKIVKVEDTQPEKAKAAAAGAAEEAAQAKPGAGAGEAAPAKAANVWKPTEEAKKKATTLRAFAIVLWVLALGCEGAAIYFLFQKPVNMVLLIVFIAVDLVLALTGSFLWKKANRLDPASEKDKAKFFIQNQLGVFISVIAFLPLVVLVFTDKNLDKKHKGILGVVAVVALLAAGFGSASYNPPSVEQYTEETNAVVTLMGQDQVYWTEYGEKYHLYDDCQHINTDATAQIYQGTVAQAHEAKNITELCKTCEGRAAKEHPGISEAVAADAAALDEADADGPTEADGAAADDADGGTDGDAADSAA